MQDTVIHRSASLFQKPISVNRKRVLLGTELLITGAIFWPVSGGWTLDRCLQAWFCQA